MSAHGESPGRTGPDEKAGRASLGAAVCVLGMLSAASGVLHIDFTFEFFGSVLGAVGYVLGARRLGAVTVVLSTVLLFVFMAAAQGEIPGVEPTDPLAL
jgi:hypothetical protein